MSKFHVGQQVVLFPNIGAACIREVTRMTPGGAVEVCETLFNGETGIAKGAGSRTWRADKIEPLTDQNRALVERAQAKRRVFSLKRQVADASVLEAMTLENLAALDAALTAALAILNEGKAK